MKTAPPFCRWVLDGYQWRGFRLVPTMRMEWL
jgi:hypothetical protein